MNLTKKNTIFKLNFFTDVVGSQLDPLMQCFSSLQNAMLVNRENIKKLESEV